MKIPVALLCFFASPSISLASVLFYGGDGDGGSAFLHGFVANDSDRIWDDFDIGAGGAIVESVFGDHLYNPNWTLPFEARIDIRRGCAPGNPGEVLLSDQLACTVIPTGRTHNDLVEYRVRVTGLHLALPQGRYWLNVWPGTFHGVLRDTIGLNAVGSPIMNRNSFHQSLFWTNNQFQPVTGISADFSYGVEGTPLPEPATIAILGASAAIAIRRRRLR